MFKKTLQIMLGVALTMQMAGCFYVGDDHRWHGGHREYRHDPGVNVSIHG